MSERKCKRILLLETGDEESTRAQPEDRVGHQCGGGGGLFRKKTLFPVWGVQVCGEALRSKAGILYHPGQSTSDRVIAFCSVKAEEAENAGKVGGAKALPMSQIESEELW